MTARRDTKATALLGLAGTAASVAAGVLAVILAVAGKGL